MEDPAANLQPRIETRANADSRGKQSLKVVDRGTCYRGSENSIRRSCAFPAICVLPGGRWICGFRAAPTKAATTGQHVLITWSDDEGRTWQEPTAPFGPMTVEESPGLFRGAYLTALGEGRVLAVLCWVDHSDPALPFFNEETQGLLDTRIFLARSENSGGTWESPALVDTSPYSVPTPITGPVLLLSNGDWACQFELNKRYEDRAEWRHASVMKFSRDGGVSWPEHVVTAHDPENRILYWDQRPGVLASGDILNLFWTYDNRESAYRNIHARVSSDDGRTWSEMWDTGVREQPAQPVSLPNGRIAMAYVDRTGAPAIRMRTSEDGGRSWPDQTEITLCDSEAGSQRKHKRKMQDAWSEMRGYSVGLPATATLENGEVVVVYYAGPDKDHTEIEWARVQA